MTKISFEQKLERFRVQINNRLIVNFSKRKPSSLYSPLIYFLKSGGKRLRAILVLLTAKSVNRNLKNLPFNQAIAIELLHNFTLIHDDIMDNSDKRHNQLTLHKKYDISTAILAGDALLAIAYEFLDKGLNKNSVAIYEEFTKGLRVVCEGQALDKEFEISKSVTLNDYFKMISMKTAALIKTTCRIGALVSSEKIDKNDLNKFGLFGEYLGIAFQIQDDLLDIIGSEKLFGKTKALDLLEGKKTFLLIKALSLAQGKDLDKLKKLIENKGISSDEVKDYINLYRKIGVIELTQKEIDHYNQLAKNVLFDLSKKYDVSNLNQFLEYVINRQY
ncbi:MAG: polyprenyl synthetase family protein [Ignavibacteria bacterium]